MIWKSANDEIDRIIRRVPKPIKDDIESAWSRLEYGQIGKITGYKNSRLTISVENSSNLQILSMDREKIKNKLNKLLNSEIKDIRFTLGG